MADAKLSSLQQVTDVLESDLLYIVTNNSGTPVSKKVPVNFFLSNFPSNTNINGVLTTVNASVSGNTIMNSATVNSLTTNTLTISGDGIVLSNKLTPASSNVSAIDVNKIFFDSNYLYIKVDTNTIKRIPLQSF